MASRTEGPLEERLLGKGDSSSSSFEDFDKESERLGGFFNSLFTVTNCAIGVGIVALPAAFALVGWALGAVLLVICALITAYGDLLASFCALRLNTRSTSYEALTEAILGRRWALLVNAAIILNQFGSCVLYLVVVGDLLPPIVNLIYPGAEDEWYGSRLFITCTVVACVITPLTLQATFHAFRWISLASLLCIGYLTSIVVGHLATNQAGREGADFAEGVVPAVWSEDILLSFPVFGLALNFTTQLVPITYELKRTIRTRSTARRLVWTGLGLITGLYVIIGTVVYLDFGDATLDNLLLLYSDTAVAIAVARGGQTLVVIASYPVVFWTLRSSLVNTFCTSPTIGRLVPPRVLHVAVTLAVVGLTVLVSQVFPEVVTILGFLGSTSGSCIAFIFPGLLYIRLLQDFPASSDTTDSDEDDYPVVEPSLEEEQQAMDEVALEKAAARNGDISFWTLLGPRLLIAFGCFLAVFGTAVTIKEAIEDD